MHMQHGCTKLLALEMEYELYDIFFNFSLVYMLIEENLMHLDQIKTSTPFTVQAI